MKTCDICGHRCDDDCRDCPVCGNAVTSAPRQPDAAQESHAAPQPATPAPAAYGGKDEPLDDAPVYKADAPPVGEGDPAAAEHRRRSNVGLWVAVGVLGVLVVGGLAWLAVDHFSADEPQDGPDETVATAAVRSAEVVDYDTDDTPDNRSVADEPSADVPADTLNWPEAVDEDDGAEAEAADAGRDGRTAGTDNVAAGTLYLTDGSGATCHVELHFDVDSDNSVSGTAYFQGRQVSVSGTYSDATGRLVIREREGGRYDGYVEGGVYRGIYHDSDGDWTFTMSLK